MAEHPGLADAGDPFVGVDLDIGQVPPRRADHMRADSGDAHDTHSQFVRYIDPRSKCCRDSRDADRNVSMGSAVPVGRRKRRLPYERGEPRTRSWPS
ncbi:hypothetical protein GCM10028832_02510 [Streptomyces sparsus]